MGIAAKMAVLAWQDYRHEWRLSCCAVLALAAVLAPLLVLFGLKYGIITTLTGRLAQDPRNREIVPVGSGRFTAGWFSELAVRPEVAFVIPRTRQIAATLDLRRPRLGRSVTVELIPTAVNDPLVQGVADIPTDPTHLVVTQSAAEKLQLKVGDKIKAAVGRSNKGRVEYAQLEITVGAILPLKVFQRDAAFALLPLLEAVEDYRDGFAVTAFGWPGVEAPTGQAHSRLYPAYRLYARTIDDVAGLRAYLLARGLEVETQAAEIDQVKTLSHHLTLVFSIIAVIGIGGYATSLGASVIAAVERKRRELSILRLVGFPSQGLILFPIWGSVLTGLIGTALAVGLYSLASAVINNVFADQMGEGEAVCRLLAWHFAATAVATLACVVCASSAGGLRAARIEPAEGLRDV